MANIYGCRPSIPDQRTLRFLHLGNTPLAAVISLRSEAPAVIDQGQIGSCVANSLANVFRYHLEKDKVAGEDFLPSRLAIYYDGRVIENTVDSDSGLTVVDGCKVLNTYGACAEHEWPYEVNQFTIEPPAKARADALHRKAVRYQSVDQDIEQIKAVLTQKLPVTIGISVYESFESDKVAQTGTVPMPAQREKNLGGHCVTIWGMDDTVQLATLQNSWGTGWGDKGFFTLPYAYLIDPNLCFERWAIGLVDRVA